MEIQEDMQKPYVKVLTRPEKIFNNLDHNQSNGITRILYVFDVYGCHVDHVDNHAASLQRGVS